MQVCTTRFQHTNFPINNLFTDRKNVLNIVKFVPSLECSYCNVFAQLYNIRRLLVRFIRRLAKFRRRNAASLIQCYWRFRIANPRFTVCKNRLLAEFKDLDITSKAKLSPFCHHTLFVLQELQP